MNRQYGTNGRSGDVENQLPFFYQPNLATVGQNPGYQLPNSFVICICHFYCSRGIIVCQGVILEIAVILK